MFFLWWPGHLKIKCLELSSRPCRKCWQDEHINTIQQISNMDCTCMIISVDLWAWRCERLDIALYLASGYHSDEVHGHDLEHAISQHLRLVRADGTLHL